jgi:hypothetical protein
VTREVVPNVYPMDLVALDVLILDDQNVDCCGASEKW